MADLAGGAAPPITSPVVVRTTEDMLNLVPSKLREAASALGLPRVTVIERIAYKAARAGMITGVLLASDSANPLSTASTIADTLGRGSSSHIWDFIANACARSCMMLEPSP